MVRDQSIQEYTDKVSLSFQYFYRENQFDNLNFHQALVKTIVDSFHLANSSSVKKQAKAHIILDSLFEIRSILKDKHAKPFKINEFIKTHLSKTNDIKSFLDTLLFGLYFGDIDLRKNLFDANLDYFLLQILAESLNNNGLRRILIQLPLMQQVQLISYSHRNYREGSFFILSLFEEMFSQGDHCINRLLVGLRRKYFDPDKLDELISKQTSLDESSLSNVVNILDAHSRNETKQLHHLFYQLLHLMIDSPLRIYEVVNSLKSNLVDPQQIKEKLIAEKSTIELRERFRNQLDKPYTLEEFQHFTELYGLEGHLPYPQFKEVEFRGKKLVDKLAALHEIFNKPGALFNASKKELSSYFSFIFALILHLEAYCRNPSSYVEGLEKLAYVMATKGKDLSRQAWLPSLMRGLNTLANFLNEKKVGHKVSLKKYPIFILDQSSDELYKKNHRYVGKLNRQYNSSIMHLSLQQILAISKKLGIEPLINTTQKGNLGYGGARNAEFLLTSVLKHAFIKGAKKPEQVIAMPDEDLKSLLQQHVLGKEADILFMGDDDIELPESTITSYANVAKELKNYYFHYTGYHIGRLTKRDVYPLNFERFVNFPLDHFLFTQWSLKPIPASVSECLIKPKFSLNLPFGGEEEQFAGLPNLKNYFTLPSIHLGGTRYPKKHIPTHFFVGMEEHLQNFIPYAFNVNMIQSLLDPLNEKKRTVFPWNDENLSTKFSCLNEVFDFVVEKKQEMQARFWRNVDHLFNTKDIESMGVLILLDRIIHEDVAKITKTYITNEKLSTAEKKSLSKIENLYDFYQRDAKLFWEYGSEVIKQIQNQLKDSSEVSSDEWYERCVKDSINLSSIIDQIREKIEKKHGLNFSNFQLTEGLQLLFHVVGAGEFNEIIQKIINRR